MWSSNPPLPPYMEHGTWNIRVAWTLAVFAWRWDTGQSTPQYVDPPEPPGPGQLHCLSKSHKNSDIHGHLPFTGGGCNASIGCNARGLILDLKEI